MGQEYNKVELGDSMLVSVEKRHEGKTAITATQLCFSAQELYEFATKFGVDISREQAIKDFSGGQVTYIVRI